MNKIRVIELLNKMASDEEVPAKIKYNYITWEWNEKQKDYIELNGATRNLFTYYLDNLTECLNYKVEIIEEPKEELEEIELIDNRVAFETIDLLEEYLNEYLNTNLSSMLNDFDMGYMQGLEDILYKIKELTANQNKIIRELKANKENE